MRLLLHVHINGARAGHVVCCHDLGVTEEEARRYHARGVLTILPGTLEEPTEDGPVPTAEIPLPEEE